MQGGSSRSKHSPSARTLSRFRRLGTRMRESVRSPHLRSAAVAMALVASAHAGDVEIPSGSALRVDGSTRVRPGEYVRPPIRTDGRDGVVVLRGVHAATLDLTGVALRGTPVGTDLDRNTGFGLVLEDCEDVTVKGGKLGGYKGCLVARRCKKLVLDGIAFDGWYGMHLLPTSAAEDQADWLYPPENDPEEWIYDYIHSLRLTDTSEIHAQDT